MEHFVIRNILFQMFKELANIQLMKLEMKLKNCLISILESLTNIHSLHSYSINLQICGPINCLYEDNIKIGHVDFEYSLL